MRHDPLRRIEGVYRLQVLPGQHGRGEHRAGRLVLPVDLHRVRLGQIAVQNKDGSLAASRIDRARRVQICHLAHPLDFIGGRADQQFQHGAARQLQCPGIRIVDGLAQYAIGVGHDGCDDVDQLRQAGDLDSVGMAHQGVEQAAHQQSIFEVVHLLKQVRRFLLVAVDRVPAARPVPHVPFVERKPQFLRRSLMTLHHVANGQRLHDLFLHAQIHGQKLGTVAAGLLGGIAEVAV